MEKIEGELVDIVDKIEKLDNKVQQKIHRFSPKRPPLFRNPGDIPNYNTIVDVADLEVHDDAADESIVSIDEFVPSPDPTSFQTPSLN